MRVRGEQTKAILVFGEAAKRLVPFVVDEETYYVPAELIRHHPDHPDCPVIVEALKAPNSYKGTATKGAELRSRTVRCTGGCWDHYESAERRRIARGDESARRDWETDGIQARHDLARRVREGQISSAYKAGI